jgi:hypothetical protein
MMEEWSYVSFGMLTFLMHEVVPKALANKPCQKVLQTSCKTTQTRKAALIPAVLHPVLCGFNSGSVLLCIHLLLANAMCNMVIGHLLCRAADNLHGRDVI